MSAKTYNSLAAVCNDTDMIDVTATITPSYDSDSNLTNQPGDCLTCAEYASLTGSTCAADGAGSGAGSIDYVKSVETTYTNKTCTAKATDDHSTKFVSLSCDGPSSSTNSFTPSDLKISSDGKYKITVTATAKEDKTVTEYLTGGNFYSNGACGGGDKGSTSGKHYLISSNTTYPESSATPSDIYYYLDIEAPTASHAVAMGYESVAQGNTLNLDVMASAGSSAQPVKLQAGYDDGSEHWGTEGSFNFATDTTDGIAEDLTEAVGVTVSCLTPVDTGYPSLARITETNDLCGEAYAPPVIDSSSDAPFDVTAGDCATGETEALVLAPLGDTDYETVACFTSHSTKGKGKIVSDPGTVHPAGVFRPEEGEDCTAVGDIVFTIPPQFEFELTGKSPAVHVFAGDADGMFFYHSGWPLEGIQIPKDDAHFKFSNGDHTLTVKTGDVDFKEGCGLGEVKQVTMDYDSVVYARAHTRHKVDVNYDYNQTFTVEIAGDSDDAIIVENPQPEGSCVNGNFVEM